MMFSAVSFHIIESKKLTISTPYRTSSSVLLPKENKAATIVQKRSNDVGYHNLIVQTLILTAVDGDERKIFEISMQRLCFAPPTPHRNSPLANTSSPSKVTFKEFWWFVKGPLSTSQPFHQPSHGSNFDSNTVVTSTQIHTSNPLCIHHRLY